MADGGALPDALLRAARPFLRSLLRVSVSRDAVLPLDEVVELLHGRDAEVRVWVRASVRALPGPCGDLYLWGDVIDAMRRGPAAPAKERQQPQADAGGLRRGTY